jgi:stress-induced morphogen
MIPLNSTSERIRNAIVAAIPDAKVVVTPGGPGHFRLEVTSASFEGQSTIAKQRAVLQAIRELMAGDGAPVHAIDTLITKTP